ncbi:SdiA-regulated domain-containing protein [Aureibaculum sp. 2210JD6-5]|uniref:SdiA-regulated domain-containing protein n=1 Tax=Aureibaculum sp. 2210JD6-5 TaxID=3103957 RepID=UPI002AAC7D56|nr:SdiA-regulated domain-containing protein [Aureibaculum sp. 2210JD6-5]MDY7394960.1 SdiA-regulated domain-containing protein [Aureibaculum sp. 2210JD6-5]
MLSRIFIFLLISLSCQTGELTVTGNLPSNLKEVSAIEITSKSDLIWVIEDAGNKNILYGLNQQGKIIKELTITNAKNRDWEDLTSDKDGNIYIGDFGNNSGKRNEFTIYKIKNPEQSDQKANAEIINFVLPKDIKSKNFEAFFLHNNNFYLFSKGRKKEALLKVPNVIGNHTAQLITTFNLPKKNNKVTSADISEDGKTIILLNHDKVWELTNFTDDNFFNGKSTSIDFEHNSQKEGICFAKNKNLFITDERNKSSGGNIYLLNLK